MAHGKRARVRWSWAFHLTDAAAAKCSSRSDLARDFLISAGMGDAALTRLPGDASTRSYARLVSPQGSRLILMDAPTAAESLPCGPEADDASRTAAGYNAMARLAACRVDAFVGADLFLRRQGFSAPEVIAFDVANGFAVMEDLGPNLFAQRIEAGAHALTFYEAAVDLLVRLHETATPDALPVPGAPPWPLLAYDDLALKTGADLFLDWQPRLAQAADFGAEARLAWEVLWAPIRARGAAGASVFTHRDYHAENLIWLEARQGLARVGLLDFQDCVRAHPAWDLLSLLQDARRDVAPELETAMLARYFAARPQVDRDAFLADYAALATLNNARIVGIFSRLIVRDDKPRYRDFLPRMWRLLARNLAHPDLAGLKAWFDRYVPEATRF
jgi:aminoglycoside/choline kinase family phosphotransferase